MAIRFSSSVRPNAINATLYDKLNFNFLRDVAPIGGLVRAPNVIVGNPSLSVKTVPEFIAYAKANPGKLNMASSGVSFAARSISAYPVAVVMSGSASSRHGPNCLVPGTNSATLGTSGNASECEEPAIICRERCLR